MEALGKITYLHWDVLDVLQTQSEPCQDIKGTKAGGGGGGGEGEGKQKLFYFISFYLLFFF